MESFLTISDSRTGEEYRIPVKNNVVAGSDLAQIQSPSSHGHGQPLKILDPGFTNTAAMHSSVARGNSAANRLEFRGHDVYDLVENHDFEEVAFLLIWGRIPTSSEKNAFRDRLAQKALEVPDHVEQVVRSFPKTSPHMTIVIGALSAALAGKPSMIPAIAGKHIYSTDLDQADDAIIEVIATYAVCLALTYSHKAGTKFNKAEVGQSHIHNVFSMMGIVDSATGTPNPEILAIMEKWWIVSADHELAHSTCATLLAGSAHADPLSCVISGITSGYGTLHLGATQSAYTQQRTTAHPSNVSSLISTCKSTRRRLMGVGHKIYKSANDPRLTLVKRLLTSLKSLGHYDPLVDVSYELEKQINADPFFTKKNLFVNFDLYWWGLYTGLGIDVDAVVPFFFVSRVVGLMAHWRELMGQGVRLWRFGMVYTGKEVEETRRGDGVEDKGVERELAKVDSKMDLTEGVNV